jgi:hypothetical protein
MFPITAVQILASGAVDEEVLTDTDEDDVALEVGADVVEVERDEDELATREDVLEDILG